jgi:hypothetical protein
MVIREELSGSIDRIVPGLPADTFGGMPWIVIQKQSYWCMIALRENYPPGSFTRSSRVVNDKTDMEEQDERQFRSGRHLRS